MTENISFSKYGRSFQETLVKLILEDRPFSDQIEEVLDVNFFELNYLRVFVAKIFEYRQKYGVHPTEKIFSSILRTELNNEQPVMQKQVRDYFARLKSSSINDEKYIKETSLDFCKKQKLKEAILECVPLIKNSSYDEIKGVIDNALKLGVDTDFGHDYMKDFELRYELKARAPISTGWKLMDDITRGGLGKGELGVVIAPTGAGKSMVLTHLGAQAIINGMNIIHYTLELSEATTGQRYDSCISRTRLGDLFSMKDFVHESIQEKAKGSLIINEYPTKSASINNLRTHLEKIKKRNHKIEMIIVDYGDLLKPIENYKEKRNELESIYEGLRSLAQEFECPVWTASQTNRSGLNAEIITMESISEAFSKCFVADMIFSVSRTIEDKNTSKGRVYIAKNRNGPDGLVYPIFMDPSYVEIKLLEPTREEDPSGTNYRKNGPVEAAKRIKRVKITSTKKEIEGDGGS